jgi:hypothetical protein
MTFSEGTANLLKDDGGGSGGVIDKGDLVDVVSIDEVFDDST